MDDAIFTRRSIRKYKEDPVEKEKLDYLLRAAMSAPSAGNEQPWEFVVVTERKVMEGIINVHPYAGMLKTAPLAIAVLGNMSRELHSGFWVQDCAAATENLLLAAASQGLGSCWMGVWPLEDRERALARLFNLPDDVKVFSIVATGYPAEEKDEVNRYENWRVHRNRW